MSRDKDLYDNRWQIIDSTQNWFRKKDRFWLYCSALSFGALFSLGIVFFSASQIPHLVRTVVDLLAIPLLVLYAFAMFWRSIEQSFLTFAGVFMMYFGIFFVYTPEITKELSSPYVANRLGVGIKHYATIDPTFIAVTCFIISIFVLSFSLAISIRPKFFKPRKF